MKIEQATLIQELRALTHTAKAQVLPFNALSLEELNYKPTDDSWSILECMEHLCRYGKFYLPEIEQCLLGQEPTNQPLFKSGWLGNYFVNMIESSNTKKMTTTKAMDPKGSELGRSTLNQFIKQLDWLDGLLIKCEKMDLSKIKTAISLSSLIRLRLGDTLRFVVYHNERHVLQAQRIAQHLSSSTNSVSS